MRNLWITAVVGMVVWLAAVPSMAAPAQRVDVCHREGNGSFHLISVAAPAVTAHINHGDALPGDPVPGQDGGRFDEACGIVRASTCPCGFTAGHLVELGLTTTGTGERCTIGSPSGSQVQGDALRSNQSGAYFLTVQED